MRRTISRLAAVMAIMGAACGCTGEVSSDRAPTPAGSSGASSSAPGVQPNAMLTYRSNLPEVLGDARVSGQLSLVNGCLVLRNGSDLLPVAFNSKYATWNGDALTVIDRVRGVSSRYQLGDQVVFAGGYYPFDEGDSSLIVPAGCAALHATEYARVQ